ncbi:MAG TPA: YciI family protein [Candidatus Margulisiibacteriota bacterium]|nr:YciI family protein [Candidatus Margulisiibacteriota bacterium]
MGHDAPDAKERRPQHRPAHLQHLEPLSQAGRVVLAGPFTDGSGSLIIVDLPSRQAVWEVVARDPYVINGIFNRVEVKPFMQVFPSAG